MVNLLLIILVIANLSVLLIALIIIRKKGGWRFLKLFLYKKVGVSSSLALGNDKIKEHDFYRSTIQDVVFVGDSLILLGSWSEFYPESFCRNRGIGGNTTQDVLDRVGNIAKNQPKKIFFLMGVNDLLNGSNIERIVSRYKEVISSVKSNSPKTEIFVKSVLPINEKLCKEVLSIKKGVIVSITNRDIVDLNGALKLLCAEERIKFLDVYSQLTDCDGQLKESLTTDGIHITFDGYAAYVPNLEQYVVAPSGQTAPHRNK